MRKLLAAFLWLLAGAVSLDLIETGRDVTARRPAQELDKVRTMDGTTGIPPNP